MVVFVAAGVSFVVDVLIIQSGVGLIQNKQKRIRAAALFLPVSRVQLVMFKMKPVILICALSEEDSPSVRPMNFKPSTLPIRMRVSDR